MRKLFSTGQQDQKSQNASQDWNIASSRPGIYRIDDMFDRPTKQKASTKPPNPFWLYTLTAIAIGLVVYQLISVSASATNIAGAGAISLLTALSVLLLGAVCLRLLKSGDRGEPTSAAADMTIDGDAYQIHRHGGCLSFRIGSRGLWVSGDEFDLKIERGDIGKTVFVCRPPQLGKDHTIITQRQNMMDEHTTHALVFIRKKPLEIQSYDDTGIGRREFIAVPKRFFEDSDIDFESFVNQLPR